MFLYITAEDVTAQGGPSKRAPRPLHTMPSTLNALFDIGMRHHLRTSVLLWPDDGEFTAVPDWKLDRLVIRLGLYCQEKLGLERGRRAVVFGRLGWLWPAAEFAVLGCGAVSVGIEHDVPDDILVAALGDADPAVIFSTDGESTTRLMDLRAAGLLPGATVVGVDTGAGATDWLPVSTLLDLAGVLDTAERAQAFRTACREVEPEAVAMWHVSASGTAHLTHSRSMHRIAARFNARPAMTGDVAYVEAPRVTLAGRLALAGFIGDGRTTAILGHEGLTADNVIRQRPHVLQVTAAWLEGVCAGRGPRWLAHLDRAAARRRVQEVLGDRARVVETERPVDAATAAAVRAAGANVLVEEQS